MQRPIARRALRRLRMNADVLEEKRVCRYGFLGLTRYRRGLPKPVPVADAELAAVSAPTLLLLGTHSEIHKSPILIARARAAMPTSPRNSLVKPGTVFRSTKRTRYPVAFSRSSLPTPLRNAKPEKSFARRSRPAVASAFQMRTVWVGAVCERSGCRSSKVERRPRPV
jgi:hypothetical protein